MSAPTAAPLVVAERTGTTADLCHVVCSVFTNEAFCGSPTHAEEFCPDEDCDKECVVCTDLERTLACCPICHTHCELLL